MVLSKFLATLSFFVQACMVVCAAGLGHAGELTASHPGQVEATSSESGMEGCTPYYDPSSLTEEDAMLSPMEEMEVQETPPHHQGMSVGRLKPSRRTRIRSSESRREREERMERGYNPHDPDTWPKYKKDVYAIHRGGIDTLPSAVIDHLSNITKFAGKKEGVDHALYHSDFYYRLLRNEIKAQSITLKYFDHLREELEEEAQLEEERRRLWLERNKS